MTHCDIIAALSNQLPLHMNLEKRFTTFIKKCLSSTNSVVNIISNIAICNPMFTEGKTYRSVLDVNGQYNNNQLINEWNLTSNRLKNLTSVLTLSDPGYFRQLTIRHPPPTISKTVVSIFTISYMCILPGVLGMFQLEFLKNSRF